jgi:hypothetical protein
MRVHWRLGRGMESQADERHAVSGDIHAQQELFRARTDCVGVVTQLNAEQYGLVR